MKHVYFHKLSIKNFLSVGNNPVEIDFKPGFNIITGLNKDKEDRRNGVGKSTIADAIYFAVFGDTLRDLKKEHISNNITQTGCEVTLEFIVKENECNTSYKIIRILSPTKCYLYVNGDDKTRDSIANTNDYINHIISSSAEIFQNCIIMTVNNTTPFMAQKKIEKRKFIEGIFNLQVFGNMLTNVRNEYNEILREFDSECVRYEEISTALNTYVTQRQNYAEQKREQQKKLQGRKTTNLRELTSLHEKLKNFDVMDINSIQLELKKILDNRALCQEKGNKYNELSAVSQVEIKHLMEQYNKMGTDGDICPTCLKKIQESDKSYIEKKKSDLDENIKLEQKRNQHIQSKSSTVRALSEKLNDQQVKKDKDIADYQLQHQEIKNIEDQINQLKQWNDEIVDDIKQVQKQDINLDETINTRTDRLEETQKTIDSIKLHISTLDVIKFIVSEEGVKSYIVKKILQLFNSKLAYYLKKMDANCICVFNEYFEEQIIDEKGKLCSYFNFSGAERKNIDLACLFAFMDIRRLQGDVAFNFSVYDELLDSSLDERGIELVVDILNERAEKYKECIMVISHRKESTKLATGEIIFLQKQNGITERVDLPAVDS